MKRKTKPRDSRVAVSDLPGYGSMSPQLVSFLSKLHIVCQLPDSPGTVVVRCSCGAQWMASLWMLDMASQLDGGLRQPESFCPDAVHANASFVFRAFKPEYEREVEAVLDERRRLAEWHAALREGSRKDALKALSGAVDASLPGALRACAGANRPQVVEAVAREVAKRLGRTVAEAVALQDDDGFDAFHHCCALNPRPAALAKMLAMGASPLTRPFTHPQFATLDPVKNRPASPYTLCEDYARRHPGQAAAARLRVIRKAITRA